MTDDTVSPIPPIEPAPVFLGKATPPVPPAAIQPVPAPDADGYRPNPYAQQSPAAAPQPYGEPMPGQAYPAQPLAPQPYGTQPYGVQPQPYAAQPQPYGQSVGPDGQPAPYAYGAYPTARPQGMALASMIIGIAGIVTTFMGFGFLVGVAAVITGHLAKRNQPYARGLWLTGLITGYITVGLGVITGLFWLLIIGGSIAAGANG